MAVTKWPRRVALGLALLIVLACGMVHAAEFESLYYSVDSFESPARSRLATADLDGDVLPDLVFSATAGSEEVLIVAGNRPDGDFAIKQTMLLPPGSDSARILVRHDQRIPSVVVVGKTGMAREFAGWPLLSIRSFSIASAATAAAIGDIDANGTDDLVVVSSTGLASYSLATGALLRSRALPDQGASDVALAQLDADPALEVIVAGNVPGVVVDGATNATDWSYIDGFGINVASGQLGAAGLNQWVGAKSYQLYTVFRANPWSPLWAGTVSNSIGAIATARLDVGGPDVIAVGSQDIAGGVRIIDSVTRQQRLLIPNPGSTISSITSRDFNGDGAVDIAFSPSYPNYAPDIVIADGTTGAMLWSFASEVVPLTGTAIGDVDGDGSLDLVSLSYRMGYISGLIISDFLTGEEKWRKPSYLADPNSPLHLLITSLKLVPKASGLGMDILLAGEDGIRAKFVVLDGVEKTVSSHAGQLSTNTTRGNRINDLEFFDYDSDGIQDFVTLSYAVSTASSGAYLHVFSGIDGTPLWISAPLQPPFQRVKNVIIVGRDGPAPKIVAVLSDQLLAFDAHTGNASWTLLLSTTVDGGALLRDGLNGEELVLFRNGGQVLLYSADTRAFLTGFALKTPLDAIIELPGQPRMLIAQSANRLTLVDASTGTIFATTEYLGDFTGLAVAPSTFRATDSTSYVAVGSSAALYRKRLVFNEHIFESDFDSPPISTQ